MGILSNHVPSIEPIRPGIVEVIEATGTQKFFGKLWRFALPPCYSKNLLVSSGFATVHPNNKLTINVVEAAPLDSFSLDVSTSFSSFTTPDLWRLGRALELD